MSGRAVLIRGVGMASLWGARFQDARSGYPAGVRRFHRETTAIGPDGRPMTLGAVILYTKLRDYAERLRRLFEMAFRDLAASSALLPDTPMRLMLPDWLVDSPVHHEVIGGIASAAAPAIASVQLMYGGPAQSLALVGTSAAAIASGRFDRIIVGGLDSLLQPELLDRLALQGRIRTRTHSYAATPAEGACLLLLAARSDDDGPPPGQVLAALQGRETEDITNPQGLIGRGLATAYREAAEHHAPDRLLTDLTGERWRAEEFGVALNAAGPRIAGLVRRVEAPALYVGDCGVANGPILTALALTDPPRALAAAPGPVAMMSASSRAGSRSVLVVERVMEGVAA